MRHLPIHWYEGVFLRPQHFQAADRHVDELLANAMSWHSAYSYGLASIDIQMDAIGASAFQVNSCRAITREGTLIEIGGQHGSPIRVNLKPAFEKESAVTVFLAVPKLNLSRSNCSNDKSASARYRSVAKPMPDENTGVGDTELYVRELNVGCMLSTDDLEGFETLPIVRLRRGVGDEAIPTVDADYFPPLLAFDAWENLSMGIVRSVFDLFGQKMEILSKRAVDRGQTLSAVNPGDLDDLLMLNQVNHGYAVLHSLTFAKRIHPFTIYVELCRLVGVLSIFGPQRQVDSQIPVYDHDDLASVFQWLYRCLTLLLGGAKKLPYERRDFIGTQLGMQVSIDPAWLHSGWKWYVGVYGENISQDVCRELLRPNVMDWKMGSDRQVDFLYKRRMPDVKPEQDVRITPRALPQERGWIYYEVSRDGKAESAWKDVLATQTLAIRFNDKFIANLEQLPNNKQLEVLYQNKRAILQFALFAVPIESL